MIRPIKPRSRRTKYPVSHGQVTAQQVSSTGSFPPPKTTSAHHAEGNTPYKVKNCTVETDALINYAFMPIFIKSLDSISACRLSRLGSLRYQTFKLEIAINNSKQGFGLWRDALSQHAYTPF